MVKVKEVIPLSNVRKRIAEKMLLSSREIPQVTLVMEVFMDKVIKMRKALKEEGYNVSLTDIIVRVVAEALKEFKLLNSRLEEDAIKVFEDININIAVDTDYGLITPVVKNVGGKSLLELSSEVRELIERTRTRKLTVSDVVGGTFTVTNLGMLSISSFNPLINYPQVAILGIGAVKKATLVEEGKLRERNVMNLCLTFDHRVIDGAYAARFLLKVKNLLEKLNPLEVKK